MATASHGTFVVSWSQTHIDGLKAAPVSSLQVGARWAWNGDIVRVDGPVGPSGIDQADGEAARRGRAALRVRQLVGDAFGGAGAVTPDTTEASFVVTDGQSRYTVSRIDLAQSPRPLLMFLDAVPPRGRDLRVVSGSGASAPQRDPAQPDAGGVICFAKGTRILTHRGLAPVETLREGDLVQTKDNGLQPVQWTGSRRMTGARLHVLPELRPVLIRAGAFGIACPEDAFLVSPEHRMLIRGAVPRELFGIDEVLVAAKHLVNGSTIRRDLALREVTYFHLLLPRHEIVFANGVETESFHPANTALSSLSAPDRTRLLALLPGVELCPADYGVHARRNLSARESALLVRQAA